MSIRRSMIIFCVFLVGAIVVYKPLVGSPKPTTATNQVVPTSERPSTTRATKGFIYDFLLESEVKRFEEFGGALVSVFYYEGRTVDFTKAQIQNVSSYTGLLTAFGAAPVKIDKFQCIPELVDRLSAILFEVVPGPTPGDIEHAESVANGLLSDIDGRKRRWVKHGDSHRIMRELREGLAAFNLDYSSEGFTRFALSRVQQDRTKQTDEEVIDAIVLMEELTGSPHFEIIRAFLAEFPPNANDNEFVREVLDHLSQVINVDDLAKEAKDSPDARLYVVNALANAKTLEELTQWTNVAAILKLPNYERLPRLSFGLGSWSVNQKRPLFDTRYSQMHVYTRMAQSDAVMMLLDESDADLPKPR